MAFGKIDGEKSNEGKDLGASRYLFEISKSGNFSLFQSGRGICDKEVNAPIKSEDIFNYTNDDIDSHYLDSYTNAEPTRNYNIESVEHSSSCLSRDDIIDKTYSNLSTNKDMLESLDESGKKYFACLQNDLIVKDVCHLETAKTSTIFWGLHTNCEDEIFKYIFDNNQNMTWEEVKFYGIGFWLKSTTILKSICEKLAKNQFQAKHNPLDAALYYLILGKKNMLVYLFRTVKDKKLMDFFNQDFSADRFRVSALKNAYALLGMQRFEHAAAFFLLSGDVQGCIQTIITKAKDLQLAFLIVKMINAFSCMEPVNMENFVCRYVVEIPLTLLEEWKSSNKRYGCFNNVSILSKHCRDPFINSIAFWHIQEYFLAGQVIKI
uniref:Rav1p_C domain-containing protein n=1 Tax=Rhabditophanes sp. KR3021 TaxID=114890 RepID=A0AC35UGC9_9BILA